MDIVIMTVITVLSTYGYVPQIIKMWKTKRSEDISDNSWWLYTIASILSVIYFLVYNRDWIVIVEGIVELLLNTITLGMSLYYKIKFKSNESEVV